MRATCPTFPISCGGARDDRLRGRRRKGSLVVRRLYCHGRGGLAGPLAHLRIAACLTRGRAGRGPHDRHGARRARRRAMRRGGRMTNLPDFKQYCEAACCKLLGEPDQRTKKKLRWEGGGAPNARTHNNRKTGFEAPTEKN